MEPEIASMDNRPSIPETQQSSSLVPSEASKVDQTSLVTDSPSYEPEKSSISSSPILSHSKSTSDSSTATTSTGDTSSHQDTSSQDTTLSQTQDANDTETQLAHTEQDQDQDPSSSTLDDIFGSPSPSPSHSPSNSQSHPTHRSAYQEPSDTARLRSIHVTAGYRDGISSAREAAVQGGFDEGYLLGAAVGGRVGMLSGLMDGICAAVKGLGTDGEEGGEAVEVESRVRALRNAMRRDLALENVLGQAFVMEDGTWAWDVSESEVEQGGVLAVAEAHPLIKRYAAVVGEWVRFLGTRRVGEHAVYSADVATGK